MAMFGLIVAGRLVSTNWEQISPTNVVSEIADADSVNHLVVFLTGILPPCTLPADLSYFRVQAFPRWSGRSCVLLLAPCPWGGAGLATPGYNTQ